MKYLSIILLIIIIPISTYGYFFDSKYTAITSDFVELKDSNKKCLLDYFKNCVIVGETGDDMEKDYLLRKPANFTFKSIFTNPDTTINYYNLKTTIGINIFQFILNCTGNSIDNKNQSISIVPFIEYNKSTFAENKSDFLKLGTVASARINIAYNNSNSTYLRLIPTVGYMNARNFKNNEWENQFLLDFTFRIKFNRTGGLNLLLPLIEDKQLIDKIHLRYKYSPNIGIEYTDTYLSESQNRIGSICRFFLKLFFTFTVFTDVLEFQSDFHWRKVIANSANYSNRITRYFDLSANLNIFEIINPKSDNEKEGPMLLLGIDYINGENPWTGDDFRKTLQLCLKFKL